MLRTLSFLIGFVIGCHFTWGQLIYPHKYFSPRTYGSGKTVLCLDETSSGEILLGSSNALIKYDGERWTKAVLPEKKAIYWIDVDNLRERIYIGSQGEFGYFTNTLQYHSLSDQLDSTVTDFGTIWEVETTSHGTYFRSTKYIFRFYNEKLSIIRGIGDSKVPFDIIFNINDTIYTRIRQIGLATIVNGKIRTLPGKPFMDKTNAFISHPKGLLVATRNNGLFIHDGKDFSQITTDADELFRTQHVYHGTALKNGLYAFAMLTGGVIIIDENGKIIHRITKDNYGIHEATGYVFEDNQNGLWIGMGTGTIRIDLHGPLKSYQFDELQDYSDYTIFNNRFYFGTINGLYSYSGMGKVEKVHQFPNLVNNVFVVNNQLFGSDLTATYQIDGNKAEWLFSEPARCITYISHEAYNYIAGGQDGLSYFKKEKGKWILVKEDKDVANNINTMLHFQDMLWGISSSSGLFSIDSSGYHNYNLENVSNIKLHHDQLIVTTADGFYEYNSGKFQKHDRLNTLLPKGITSVNDFFQSGDSTWVLYYTENQMLTGDIYKGNELLQKLPLFDVFSGDQTIIELHDNILYVGANKDILTFNPSLKIDKKPVKARITGVEFETTKEFSKDYGFEPIRFDFSSNVIPSFGDNFYRYKISNYNNRWSAWTTQNYMEITNLFEGHYTLHLQVQTPYREIGDTSLQFIINPPWYRTIWAYIMYVLALSGFIWGFVKWRSRYLENERDKLEKIVRKRTTEISKQKATIEQSLEEREALLREIHHRVKNNLQVITSIFNMQLKDTKNKEMIKLINDGQSRIKAMSLIHQKLYKSDNIKLIEFESYVYELARQIESVYKVNNKINYNIKGSGITLDTDTAIPIGLILNELISNSFKYAFDPQITGNISISLSRPDNSGYELHYHDDGKGLPDEKQLDSTNSLGIRLIRILTRQLKGHLEVSNHKGAHFKINFKPV